MRLLLDENVDARLVQVLEAQDHTVASIVRDFQQALTDSEVLDIAVREQRVLITRDLDFGELVFKENRPHSGVILLRLRTTRLPVLQSRLTQVLSDFADEMPQFLVVSERLVRVRGL